MTYQDGGNDTINKYAWVKVTTIAMANDVCPQVSDSVQMLLFLYPEVDMKDPASGCVPLTTDFTGIENRGIAPGNLTWAWDFGNGQTSILQNPTGIVYPTQGKYTVTLTVTNTSGPCPSNKISVDYINAYPLPVANFVTDPVKTTIALPRFHMDNRSTLDKTVFTTGSMSYRWDFDDPVTDPNDTSTLQNPRFSYGKDTNTYNITLIVVSDHGCSDTFTQRVVIGPDIIVFIPDVFTPDGAGPNRNNTFMISALNFKSMKMMVFNRWGELLYETTEPTKGWDGYANGVLCHDGVYVYKVEVTSMDGKVFKYDGTVTLLR
jgi:gliding motility-associated-like protein